MLHGDETPVAMLKPGNGKTHRAYLWAYAPGAFEATRAVVYNCCESRAGEHARAFLGDWRGSLICDDYSGYKASRSPRCDGNRGGWTAATVLRFAAA